MEVPDSNASLVYISRFGEIPNKCQPGKLQLSVDISSPQDHSINEYIDSSLYSLSYASVEDAAAFVFEAGCGSLLAKLDIGSVHPNSSGGSAPARFAVAQQGSRRYG